MIIMSFTSVCHFLFCQSQINVTCMYKITTRNIKHLFFYVLTNCKSTAGSKRLTCKKMPGLFEGHILLYFDIFVVTYFPAFSPRRYFHISSWPSQSSSSAKETKIQIFLIFLNYCVEFLFNCHRSTFLLMQFHFDQPRKIEPVMFEQKCRSERTWIFSESKIDQI